MNGITQGLMIDAIAEMSLETEMETLTESDADCWATRQQIMAYLGVQDWHECADVVRVMEEQSLVIGVEDRDAWMPTSAGWTLWQERNGSGEGFAERMLWQQRAGHLGDNPWGSRRREESDQLIEEAEE